MCRFVMYLGPPITMSSLITEPSHSLIHQSLKSRERSEPLNGDGFGVAWYQPEVHPDPAVFRAITPAWSNANLQHLSRATRSRCILAHIRAASPGLPVTQTNCHPFSAGRYSFMHNGLIADFKTLRRRIIGDLSDEAFAAIEGNTDSEHVFGLFLDRIRDRDAQAPVEAIASALAKTLRHVLELVRERGSDEPTDLNLAVSDGISGVACRVTTREPDQAASLYVHSGSRYTCSGGLCRMIEPEKIRGAIIISSEPLSDDPGWEKVPPNHLVLVPDHAAVELRPLLDVA